MTVMKTSIFDGAPAAHHAQSSQVDSPHGSKRKSNTLSRSSSYHEMFFNANTNALQDKKQDPSHCKNNQGTDQCRGPCAVSQVNAKLTTMPPFSSMGHCATWSCLTNFQHDGTSTTLMLTWEESCSKQVFFFVRHS